MRIERYAVYSCQELRQKRFIFWLVYASPDLITLTSILTLLLLMAERQSDITLALDLPTESKIFVSSLKFSIEVI